MKKIYLVILLSLFVLATSLEEINPHNDKEKDNGPHHPHRYHHHHHHHHFHKQGINKCKVCYFVINSLEPLLEEGKKESEIIEILTKEVSEIFPMISNVIRRLFQKKVSLIIELFKKDYPPAQICEIAGCCKEHKHVPNRSLKCSVCLEMLSNGELYEIHDSVKLEEEIINNCSTLPKMSKDICDDIVDESILDILVGINDSNSNTQICKDIDCCEE
ncbi:saposin-like protein family [Anaeramoeba flamelloides]|uniref:Saposin-like protein family n=1 Tax=Anaeramoeba flamelloides TaxID=1746091 RepID=A0ABQ8Y3R9_9EUKA|nr:saposin-like protein family [Anaeramoeba flamelloides]